MAMNNRKRIVIAAAVGLCVLAAILFWLQHKKTKPAPVADDNAAATEHHSLITQWINSRDKQRRGSTTPTPPAVDDVDSAADDPESLGSKPLRSSCLEEIRDEAGRVIFEATDRGCNGHLDNCLHFFYDEAGNRDQIRGDPKCDGVLTFCSVMTHDDHGTIIRAETRLDDCNGPPSPDYSANCFRPQYDDQGRPEKVQVWLCANGPLEKNTERALTTYTYGSNPNEAYQRFHVPGAPDRCAIIFYDEDRKEIGFFEDDKCAGKIDSCRIYTPVDEHNSRSDYFGGDACLGSLEKLRAQ